MSWLLSFLLVAVYLCYNLANLFINYLKARKIGVPVIVVPIPHLTIPWMVLSVPLRPVFEKLLPQSLYDRLHLAIYGWEFRTKWKMFAKYGRTFVVCTCSVNELSIADPDLAYEVLRRPKEFNQLDIGNRIMNIFGTNLITSDGEHWSKQRRLIAPNLNERISDTVFQESCRQAREMLDCFMAESNGVTAETIEGLKVIAINVLATAGYGTSQRWKEEKQLPQPGYQMTYTEATRLVVDHIVEAAMLPVRFLLLPFMPQSLRRLGYAVQEFPQHTKQLLETERRRTAETGVERTNLMSTLVRLQATGQTAGDKVKASQTLSEQEIIGNLFIFTAAGFDTTANTMAYACTLLAAHPQHQEWQIEQLDEVLEGKGEDLDYDEIFPQLTRCLALMYETMRLFNPLAHISKMPNQPVTVQSSGRSYHIPAHTTIYVSPTALHSDPAVWGDDAQEFRPSRWLSLSNGSSDTEKPSLITMPKGSFVAWSAGPRSCPGSKMSQVEFVAVMMTIFRKYRVEPVPKENESKDQACARLVALTQDSQPRVTLQMNNPREIKLRWIRR